MATDFAVSLREDTERGRAWAEVFGTTRVHVRSPLPEWVTLPERGAALVFFLDLALLSTEQRERLIEYLAQKFGLAVSEVATEIDKAGVPILAEECTVTVYNPHRWF
jgi:hypothetical protein